MHFNELPFRALFVFIDGVTDGPKSFTGSIGKELNNCEQRPVVKFKSIDCSLPDIDPQDLSTDQKYLYNIAKAIKNGSCTTDLSYDKPRYFKPCQVVHVCKPHPALLYCSIRSIFGIKNSCNLPVKELYTSMVPLHRQKFQISILFLDNSKLVL